jgi:hypothetical protein
MDLNTLLSTLNQGPQTGNRSQISPSAPVTPSAPAMQRIDPVTLLAAAAADVYHSSSAPASASLLSQSGVNAYIQLLNALSTQEQTASSANLLTSSLLEASATLKSAYMQAVSRLSPQLQTSDWRFSVSDGNLVFAPGQDELSAQDLADIGQAFAGSNVEWAANQVATAITSMQSQRESGADFGSLAWGRFAVDDSNFSEVVDLRAYLVATAPGGNYDPQAAGLGAAAASAAQLADVNLPNHPEIPLILGGMYLGDLVTSRPDFFRTSNPTAADGLSAIDAPPDTALDGILQGRCSCGEVRFTVENAVDYAYYCHCSRCRLRTGSLFAAIAGVSLHKVQVTAGDKQLLIEGECSDGYGARCARCYTFLFSAVRGRQFLNISLGVLMGTPTRLPDHHIYVGSKAPWYRITDGLPQYDELP